MPFSITINPASTAPAWFTALPYNTVTQIGTGSMQAVSGLASQYYGLTDAWIGGAVDQSRREFVIGAPGGHTVSDATNNAVYVFRLGDASPQWYRTRNGDTGSSNTVNSAGQTSSGNPIDTHSYHRQCASPGRLWMPGLDSMTGADGQWTTSTFSYDLTQNSGGVWNRHGRWQTGSVEKMLGGSSAYDPVTERIFSVGQYGFPGSYFHVPTVLAAGNVEFPNAVTGVVNNITIPNQFGGGPGYSVMMCADDLRLLILMGDNTALSTMNPDSPTGWTGRSLGSGNNYSDGMGMVYHRGTRRIYRLARNGGTSTIRVIDIPTTISNSWTGRNVTLTGTLPSVDTARTGAASYSKFNIIHDMGNGEACLVWYPRRDTTGMYVVRVPAGGL